MARYCIEAAHKLLNIPALRLIRPISQSAYRQQSESEDVVAEEDQQLDRQEPKRPIVDPETSIRYLSSSAYKEAYGDDPVWKHYRRNFKGSLPPRTRKTCVRKGEIATGSPCPVCRDEFLVLDMKNVHLLEQFISPYTGEVYDFMKTGLCQTQHKKLVLEVLKARNHGLIESAVPFRRYDYSEYMDDKLKTDNV
ncbi:28S ribosomal protein S18b, mitochondrial-like [Haliotis rubra]|uniref:28S ribosomal protein S18b, mitochondrial-like n=1 Tax=Haliotis rubra TaxID=36100 RepID=UPI001EE51986|nr:28S ribosomal protein S18b, mitochondrial-like [Haliotis rubra]